MDERGVGAEGEGGRKLPYEKPTLTWEEPLASQPSLMAGCQKVGANPPDCFTNPSS